MTEESNIFGLRFGSNPDLAPRKEDVEQFLLRPKRKGPLAAHEEDLAKFRRLVQLVADYDRDLQQDTPRTLSLRDRMFYSVLSYSSLFSPQLIYTVELYKYYLDEFLGMDLRKHQSFITAARQEIADLNPRKKHEAEKLAKLEHLATNRENFIKTLMQKRDVLPRELEDIITYIRDNIARISDRCEKAIVILAQLAVDGSEERRLIRDVKNQVEQTLKEDGELRRITKADLDVAQKDLTLLTKEITALLREDVYALSTLYEAIQEHTKTIAEQLSHLLSEANQARPRGLDAERDLFSRGEQVLVALLSDLRLSFKLVKPVSRTGYGQLLELKREEMLASFQEHARKERRTRKERRSGKERRKIIALEFEGPEQRRGKERRTGRGRRRS